MAPGQLHAEVFPSMSPRVEALGKTWGGGCQLAWEHLGILHLDKVAEERQDWASLLRHLPWLNG